jgi:hypothetical protein
MCLGHNDSHCARLSSRCLTGQCCDCLGPGVLVLGRVEYLQTAWPVVMPSAGNETSAGVLTWRAEARTMPNYERYT